MADMNIRGVPEELLRLAKMAALQREVPLREMVIEVLSKEVGYVEQAKPAGVSGRPAGSASQGKNRGDEVGKRSGGFNRGKGPAPASGDGGRDSVASVQAQGKGEHNPKTCRVRGCGLCAVSKGGN